MSTEYRFLRFEVVGIATIVFLVVGFLPLVDVAFLKTWASSADIALAIIAGLFLLSLPVGYAQHQIVVNVYRSQKASRAIFRILEDMVLNAQESCSAAATKKKPFFGSFDDIRKNSFLTSLLDLCVYSKQSISDPAIFSRLSERWSHFYARRAIGRYAPIFGILLWILAIIIGYTSSWPIIFQPINYVISILWWIAVFSLSILVMDRYAKKIWLEISFLESSIVLANQDKIGLIVKNIVQLMVEHPEYIEQGESYGAAIYRM